MKRNIKYIKKQLSNFGVVPDRLYGEREAQCYRTICHMTLNSPLIQHFTDVTMAEADASIDDARFGSIAVETAWNWLNMARDYAGINERVWSLPPESNFLEERWKPGRYWIKRLSHIKTICRMIDKGATREQVEKEMEEWDVDSLNVTYISSMLVNICHKMVRYLYRYKYMFDENNQPMLKGEVEKLYEILNSRKYDQNY